MENGFSFYVVLFISNLFNAFIIYNFLKVFFKTQIVSDRFILSCFLTYEIFNLFIISNIKVPIVNLLIAMISTYLFTLFFKSNIQRKIIFTLTIGILFYFAEFISYLIIEGVNYTNFFGNTNYEYFILGLYISTMVKYLVLLVAKKFEINSIEKTLPKSSWLSIFALLLLSLVLSILVSFRELENSTVFVASICILLLMNLLIMLLYNKLNHFYVDNEKRNLLEMKSKYFEQQLIMINASNENIKSVRHDLLNVLTMIKMCIQVKDTDRALIYIDKEVNRLDSQKVYVETGNFELDSILNFKINEMTLAKIKFNLDLRVPSDLKTEDMDLIIILGNLLDNAIEANEPIKENKYVDISIVLSKSCLSIKITNPYSKEIKVENGRLISSKKDKEFHGIGMKNVRNAVDYYNGTINFEFNDGIFESTVLLYL